AGATLTGPNEVKQCAGRPVHITCHYHPFYRDNVKYWCEGYYFNHCRVLLRTGQSLPFYEPLQISDNKQGGFFTIHMKNAKAADSGWYWCAIERVSRHVSISMQLIISAEAEHCSVTESPQNVRKATTQPLTTCASTTFRTTTITTSTMHTTLKTADFTEIKHETVS
ncbi:CMRF35-like molecule 3, partial [Clarias magur]